MQYCLFVDLEHVYTRKQQLYIQENNNCIFKKTTIVYSMKTTIVYKSYSPF